MPMPHFYSKSTLLSALSFLSLVSSVHGYDYSASSLQTGRTVVIGIYALAFIVLGGLCIVALANARQHRAPYAPLLIATTLAIFSELASVAYYLLVADLEFSLFTSGEALIATAAISRLFWYWSIPLVFLAFAHLIKVRTNNVVRSAGNQNPGLNVAWTGAYFVAFIVLMIFATATSGIYIRYRQITYGSGRTDFAELKRLSHIYDVLRYLFNALWYTSTFLLGMLAVVAYHTARRATGVADKILKILLRVVLPIHVLHVIVDIVFTILFSRRGLSPRSSRSTIEGASLAGVLLTDGLHAATIAVIVFLGLRRSNWALIARPSDLQKGQNVSQPVYPVQVVYPVQQNYQYQTQQ